MSEVEILESVNKMPDSSKLALIDKIYSLIYKDDIILIQNKANESEARIESYENGELESFDANSVMDNL